MRVLVDTDVLLDVLMAREPYLERALALLAAIETGRVRGVLGATTVTTVFYLAAKAGVRGGDASGVHARGLPRGAPRRGGHRRRLSARGGVGLVEAAVSGGTYRLAPGDFVLVETLVIARKLELCGKRMNVPTVDLLAAPLGIKIEGRAP